METQVRTPNAIFGQPQRFLVPLFQRPYVWNEEQQWEPLWKDLERVAARLLRNPSNNHEPHFLWSCCLAACAESKPEEIKVFNDLPLEELERVFGDGEKI